MVVCEDDDADAGEAGEAGEAVRGVKHLGCEFAAQTTVAVTKTVRALGAKNLIGNVRNVTVRSGCC